MLGQLTVADTAVRLLTVAVGVASFSCARVLKLTYADHGESILPVSFETVIARKRYSVPSARSSNVTLSAVSEPSLMISPLLSVSWYL